MTNNKSNTRLIFIIAAFVVFDLGALASNFLISSHIQKDAVAINLAGRQRMLSQRVAKAALLTIGASTQKIQHVEAVKEAADAYQMFQTTLTAFAEGGIIDSSAGQQVRLSPVQGQAALLVGDIRGILRPWPIAPPAGPEMAHFARFMVDHNLAILELSDQLTTQLERQSRARVFTLQIAQLALFALSLANFILILFLMHRARQRAEFNSITDALTGLRNRGGLYQALMKEVTAHNMLAKPLGVILFDLDGFKEVNDIHGHAAGDLTLVEAAHRLTVWSRPEWICGRLGGDEFAVICPNISAEALAEAAADLVQVMSGLPGGDHLVSASVGWAYAENDVTEDSLLAQADASMYAEKSKRKDKLSVRGKPRENTPSS